MKEIKFTSQFIFKPDQLGQLRAYWFDFGTSKRKIELEIELKYAAVLFNLVEGWVERYDKVPGILTLDWYINNNGALLSKHKIKEEL